MSHVEWSPALPAQATGVIALVLLATVFILRHVARIQAAGRLPLVLLRLAVLGLLILVLLNPVSVTESQLPPRLPEIIALVDCSRSMSLDRPMTRTVQVHQTFRELADLTRRRQDVRLSMFRFGTDLQAVLNDDFAPEDDATNLLRALEQLPAHFGNNLPAGVIVFSDGRSTEQEGFRDVAEAYRRLAVPIHTFPVGNPANLGDVSIQDLVVPRDAAAGARVPIRVLLRAHGLAGRRAEVCIRRQDDPKGNALATLPITLTDGPQEYTILLDHRPANGKLWLEVPPLPGEITDNNNRIALQIGERKQKIRVLYMEGTTGGEYRWIRDALIEDPNIECIAMEVSNQYDVRPVLYRIGDPSRGYPATREELFEFDVVICSDIKRSSFSQQQLEWTAELVSQRGGGFVMIGGNTSFGAGYWDKTVWDELIPADMGGQANSPGRGTCWGVTFKVQVPPQVERHPIWRIADDPVKNRAILDSMPPFLGTNLIERLKPAATALGYSDQPLPRVGQMVVFACESYGKGRTFAMSSDSTVDWGRHFESQWGENGDNRYFRKFWRNVVTWLAENSAGANRRLRVEIDKTLYRPGQKLAVSAQAFDDKLEATTRYRLVSRLCSRAFSRAGVAVSGAVLQEVELKSNGNGTPYTGELKVPLLRQLAAPPAEAGSPLRTGLLQVLAYDGERLTAQSEIEVQVHDDPQEFLDPRPDRTRLEKLATHSGGRVLESSSEAVELLKQFRAPPGEKVVERHPIWDNAGIWSLLVIALSLEWLLRRWWGLA